MPAIKKLELIDVIIDACFDKKAENIVSMDLKKVESRFCDSFVICHAQSNVHVQSVADGIYRKVRKELHISPHSFEGYENAGWILLDYSDIVVHVFRESDRRHYNLESLWADGKLKKHLPAELKPVKKAPVKASPVKKAAAAKKTVKKPVVAAKSPKRVTVKKKK
jgi:ribosome-associated protein